MKQKKNKIGPQSRANTYYKNKEEKRSPEVNNFFFIK